MKRFCVVASAFLLLAACGGKPASTGAPLNQTQAQLALIDRYDPLWCDPDSYPLGRPEAVVRAAAVKWYDSADRNSEEVKAIEDHEHLSGKASLTPDEKLRVYTLHKRLRTIVLDPGDGGWRFRVVTQNGGRTEEVLGSIDRSGRIKESARRKTAHSCPICLSGDTLIATPHGDVPVRTLRAGMLVYTAGARGERIAQPVIRIVRRAVAVPHLTLRVVLRDGRTLVVSPRHPAADGTPLGRLTAGDELSGGIVARARLEQSTEPFTYDLLPAGPTGDYWADGILVGSTLS